MARLCCVIKIEFLRMGVKAENQKMIGTEDKGIYKNKITGINHWIINGKKKKLQQQEVRVFESLNLNAVQTNAVIREDTCIYPETFIPNYIFLYVQRGIIRAWQAWKLSVVATFHKYLPNVSF